MISEAASWVWGWEKALPFPETKGEGKGISSLPHRGLRTSLAALARLGLRLTNTLSPGDVKEILESCSQAEPTIIAEHTA